MITKEDINLVLPVVANNWQSLRKCDVFRLLNQIHYTTQKGLTDAGNIIKQERPEFTEEVDECVAELRDEVHG